jgi:hypothetical protein
MQSVEMGKFNVDLISMLIHAILHILGRTSHVNATMCQDATSEAVQCKTASTNFVLICCIYVQTGLRNSASMKYQNSMWNTNSLVNELLKMHNKEQQDLCKLINRTHYTLPQCGKLKGTKLVY